jgi:CDP-diacylglycerol--glycerol-3-phosphate 3-phosphatidyltransferase
MQQPSPAQRPALNGLRKRWAIFVVLCVLFLVSGYTFLGASWRPDFSRRWLILAAAATIYPVAVLLRNLPANHRANEDQLLPTLGWGNCLTLLRSVLVAGLIGFLLLPRPGGWLAWIPGLLYTLACIADFFDGYLARITHHATRLGEILDISFDGLGILAASVLAVQYKQVPTWYLSIAMARYLFLGGQWLRQRLGMPIYNLPSSTSRRALAGFQMGLLAIMLWPLFSPPGTFIAAALFGFPFLAGFSQDWLFVSGVIHPSTSSTRGFLVAFKRWFPVALRLAILVLSMASLWQYIQVYPDQGLPLLILLSIETLVIIMMSFGIASRIAAIFGLFLIGAHQMFMPLNSIQFLLAAAYTAILFLGSGALSLWAPEDYLVYHRAGEKQNPQTERGV